MARLNTGLGLLLVLACSSSKVLPDGAVDGAVDGAPAPRDGALRDAATSSCVVGTALPCDCPDVSGGYSYCDEDRRWGECECAFLPRPTDAGVTLGDAGTPDGAAPGDAGVPDDDGGVIDDGGVPDDGGVRDSGPIGDAGSPDGSPGLDAGFEPGPGCTGDPEWCDGFDNDCDGIIDEGHPCPDSRVRNTQVHDRYIWLGSERPEADCQKRLSRIGTLFEDGIPIACPLQIIRFDGSDDALYYLDREIFEVRPGSSRVDTETGSEVVTPPCFDGASFGGFDGEDRFVYQCGRTVRRGNGELLASLAGLARVVEVLSSGRMLVGDGELALVDVDGTMLSAPPIDEWVGTMFHSGGIAVSGDSAFVAYRRIYRGATRREVVIFRVDGRTAEWRLVRRVPVNTRSSRDLLPLPDGRVYEVVVFGERSEHTALTEFPIAGSPRRLVSTSETDPNHRQLRLVLGPEHF